jgi:hypothetical protein
MPKPVPKSLICDTCDQPWELHTDIDERPTKSTCIQVLKHQLDAMRSPSTITWIGNDTYTSTPWTGSPQIDYHANID